jgi:prefoldin alpha subunit
MMENTVEVYQQRSQLLGNAMTNLRIAEKSLTDLKSVQANTPILVPVGGDAFVNAQMGDIKRVLVNVGADVSVEMDLNDALKDIQERLEEIEKGYEAVQNQLQQIVNQIRTHQGMIERITSEIQGETPSV